MMLTCAIITALLFYFIPQIDLLMSGWFYDETHHFYLSHTPAVIFVHRAVPYVTAAFVAGAAIWGMMIFWNTRSMRIAPYLGAIYLISACALGPGIMVHQVFKDYFQRSRPVQSREFGGQQAFTPAFVVGKECVQNCSFVSGHAAVGFMFYALAFIPPLYSYRIRIFAIGTILGAIFGIGRVMQGGHFLSDIVFAGFVVYFTCYYLALFFQRVLKMR